MGELQELAVEGQEAFPVLAEDGAAAFIGVPLDTLLVRSVLVPALVSLLGRRFWWPGALSREGVGEGSARGQYVGAHHDE